MSRRGFIFGASVLGVAFAFGLAPSAAEPAIMRLLPLLVDLAGRT
jgi:hypothetical protein